MFILGMQYLSLGALRCVFGVRYAVSVLVTKERCILVQLQLGAVVQSCPPMYIECTSRLIRKSNTKLKSFELGKFQIQQTDNTREIHI